MGVPCANRPILFTSRKGEHKPLPALQLIIYKLSIFNAPASGAAKQPYEYIQQHVEGKKGGK